MSVTISRVTFRISASLTLALFAVFALLGSVLPMVSSSTRLTKKGANQPVVVGDNPYIKLQARELQMNYEAAGTMALSSAVSAGSMRPLAMASSDVDRDGYPDLVCGYGTAGHGILTVHRADRRAFAPEDPEILKGIAQGVFPDPFLPDVRTYELPEAPDFMGAGDFNRDGRADIVVAARGGSILYLLEGDEDGGFSYPQQILLPGSVTALITGSVNDQDGLADVIVGIDSPSGSSILIYEGAKSILETEPESHPLPAKASSLALGRLDEDRFEDLAVLAGGQVLILHGRDNSGVNESPVDQRAGTFETVQLPFAVTAMALGEFIWDRDARTEIAALGEDGTVHIATRGELDTRPWTSDEILESRRQLAKVREKLEKARIRGERLATPAPSVSSQPLNWELAEDLPGTAIDSVSTAAIASEGGASRPMLLGTRMSAQPSDDLLVMNPGARQFQVTYKPKPQGDSQLASKAAEPASVGFTTDDEPVAVLPMRVNVDGRPGLVVMSKGKSAPTVFLPLAATTFTVTRSDDPNPVACSVGNCSLRAAIVAANANVGADTIVFNAGINPVLTRTGSDNTASLGDLDINDSVTITGNGAANTVIDTTYTTGCGDCKVFGVNQDGTHTGMTVSFTGVTIQNGFNDFTPAGTFQETGGGIDFFLTGTGVSYSLTNCVVNSNVVTNATNSAQSYGGGINIDSGAPNAGTNHGSVTLTGTTISSNQSDSVGGGIGARADVHNLTISGCTITGNTTTSNAIGVGAQGGGIDIRHTNGGTVTINSTTTISNNTARGQGGGLNIVAGNTQTTFSVSSTTFSGNTSQNSGGPGLPTAAAGGGMFLSNSATLTNVTVSTNHADLSGSGNSSGGGIFVSGGTVSLSGTSSITNNTSNGTAGRGGGVVINGGTFNLTGVTVSGNQAAGDGGGFFVDGTGVSPNNAKLNITGGSITGNSAANGGALATDSTSTAATTITSTSITNNTASTDTGGILTRLGSTTIDGITFTGNTSPTVKTTGGTTNTANTVNIDNSITTSGGTLSAGSSSVFIGGNFAFSGGTFTSGTSTFTFNGTGAQSISGPSSPTFNNLIVNKASGTLTLGVNIGVAGNLTVTAGTFDLATFTANRTAAGGTLTVSNGATLKIGGTNTLPSNYTTHSIGATSNIDYSGTNQNVSTLNSAQKYGNLLTSGSGTKTLLGAIGIATSLTIGAGTTLDVSASNFAINDAGNWTNNGTFTPRSGTVTFDGTSGTQTLAGNTTFFNLTLNNSGATTAFGATSTTIGGNFVTTAGTMNGGTSTITFTGNPGSISGASAKNFNNLVVNAGAVITNTTGGDTNIANDYTNNGSFTQAAGLTTTFVTGADGNHSFSGGGTTTFGIFTINGSNTVDAGSHNFSVVGATFTATGNFTGSTSTATFNGSVAQQITGDGAKNFGGLTINNASGVTLNNGAGAVDASVSGALTLTTDLTIALGAILQQSGTSAGAADALGTVRRTDLGAAAKAFGNPNVTISVDAGTAPNPMDVTLAKMAPPDFTTSVTRTYTLTPTGGSGISATVKLHYLNSELNGNAEAKLVLWKKIASTWTPQGRTGVVDTVNKAVTLTGVTSFSDWTLAAVDPPTISKAFTASTIQLNGTTTLSFTITNPNATTGLTGVSFTDNLPAGLVVADIPNVVGVCSGTVTANAGSGTISLSGGSIAASSNCIISVDVKGTTAGVKNNTTDAPSSTEAGTGVVSNTATLTVVAPPTISKAFDAATIPLNGTSNLTFTLTNPNTTTALTGVGFTDTLPAGLTVPSSGPTATCGGTLTTTAPNTITLTGASIAASGNCSFMVTVTGATAGVKNNTTGNVSSTEGGTGGTASASITVVAPPTISKAFGTSSIALGGTTSLTFTITNPNTTVALTGVGFTDTLPAGLTVPDSSTSQCGGTLTIASNVITLSGATIAASGSCSFSVTVTGATGGVKNNTTGAVTSTNGGTGATSNTASLTVASPPTITKAFGVSSIQVGQTASLQFTITNPNTGLDLTGIAFTDTLPAGLTVASGSTTTCGGTLTTTAPSTIAFTGGTLAASGSCNFTVTVTGESAGVKNNTTGAISSNESGAGATSNTATLTVVGSAGITKAFGAPTIPLNGTTTLTFTVTNSNTTTTLTGVSFTDSLPAGLQVASTPNASSSCGGTFAPAAGDTTLSFSGGTIAASGTCTISVDITGTTAGVKNNTTGNVSSNEGGTGGTASASITVVAPPTISKSFDPTTIALNGTSTLTFTITNPNATVALTGVAFSDTLPAGLTVPDSSTTVCGGTLTTTNATGLIALSGATIAASGTCTFSVNVTGTTGGVKNNTTGAVTSTNGGTGGTASASISVLSADLAVTKSDSPDPVIAGNNITYTINFTNNGPSDAQTVTLTDAVPANTTFVSATVTTGTGWSTSAPAVGGTGNVVFSKATVASGEAAVFTMVVHVNTNTANGATITNSATAASATSDPTPGNNTGTATTTVQTQADLAVTKTDSPDPVVAGNNLTYAINFTNNGPSDAQSVSVTDAVPANTTFVSATVTTGSGWSVSAPAVGGTGNVVFSKATVTGGETAVFTIVVNVNLNTPNNTTITNSAIAASSTTDPTPGNNTGTTTTTVISEADLAVTKSAAPDPACVGANLTYTIGFVNNGPGPGVNTTVTDAVPANTTFISAMVTSGMGWTIMSPPVGGTGNVVFSKASTAIGEMATFQIVVSVNAGTLHGTVISNTVTAASSLPDPTPGNNSATTMTTVDPTAPTIVCPSNVTGVTNQNVCQQGGCATVNYTTPTAMDNCPGVQVVCSPPSGACMPTGSTTVTCTATDTAGNTASCSFSVTVFDVCLQDDTNPNTVLLFNSQTGAYKFCCGGTTYTGTGTVSVKGCLITLSHSAGDRRLSASIDKTQFKGIASLQSPPGVTKCTITDRDIRNNTCKCT
ncbi:MAG TPA: HYR domain-containing protein [Blastocatellia bacterium]|nr:HYR domain-containing protein [Blastocatellia bacterium]